VWFCVKSFIEHIFDRRALLLFEENDDHPLRPRQSIKILQRIFYRVLSWSECIYYMPWFRKTHENNCSIAFSCRV
jgi:hypothetical protein